MRPDYQRPRITGSGLRTGVNVQAGLGAAACAIREVSTVLTGTDPKVLVGFRQSGRSVGSTQMAGGTNARLEARARTRDFDMAETRS